MNKRSTISSIVYPTRCLSCSESTSQTLLCETCESSIHYIDGEVVSPNLDNRSKQYSVVAYEGPVLNIIHHFKYERERSAEPIVDQWVKRIAHRLNSFDAIVPVPEHWFRYLRRGYNPAAEIARSLSKHVARPILWKALSKGRHTKRQVGLSFEERQINLKNAFQIPRLFADNVEGRRLLLVDDVLTSGTTVNECLKVLRRSKAKRVDVLTLAKTV